MLKITVYAGKKASLKNGLDSYSLKLSNDSIGYSDDDYADDLFDAAYNILAKQIKLDDQDSSAFEDLSYNPTIKLMLEDAKKQGFISDYKIKLVEMTSEEINEKYHIWTQTNDHFNTVFVKNGEFYLEGDADEPENFGKGLDALEGIKDRLYSDRGLRPNDSLYNSIDKAVFDLESEEEQLRDF